MVDNDNITNFLNSLAYHTDFDGVNLEDITLEMIDGCSTHTTYSYRAI